jgi:hypothetical protein
MLPASAMPSAAPISRVASLPADATPYLSGGTLSVIALVAAGAMTPGPPPTTHTATASTG